MPMKWDQAADAQLLTAILKCHNFKLDHLAIAKEMGYDLTEIAIKRRLERIKAMVGSKEGSGGDTTTSSPQATPSKKANGIKNGFTPINKSKIGASGANKNAESNGTASDANDADDDCTPSATGNDTESTAAAANHGETVSEATKAGASKPSSTGKSGTRGGKGSRGGSRGGRAGGSAGSKRKISASADPNTSKPSPKTTKGKVGANGKVKKSVKAAGPRPVGPISSTFCFFDPPMDELVESDDEKEASEAAAKEETNDENGDVAGEYAADDKKTEATGSKGLAGDDNDGNDDGNVNESDNDNDALQAESPDRKKVKLEDVTAAASEILNDVTAAAATADVKETGKMVGVETSA